MQVVWIRADRLPFKRSCCRKCQNEGGYLGQYIQQNGQSRCRWVCGACKDYFTTGDLPHGWLKAQGIQVDQLPVCRDRSGEKAANAPFDQYRCVICNEGDAQGHHWAPQSIFPDWPYELTQPLCERHHSEWHDRMRLHGLRYPHELAALAS